jgi:hypothetical protein
MYNCFDSGAGLSSAPSSLFSLNPISTTFFIFPNIDVLTTIVM